MGALSFIIAIINTVTTLALPNMGWPGTCKGGTELALLMTYFGI